MDVFELHRDLIGDSAIAAAIESGWPYQTRLDPPPGPPADEAGNFTAMADWDKANWPSHIHPPREEGAAP